MYKYRLKKLKIPEVINLWHNDDRHHRGDGHAYYSELLSVYAMKGRKFVSNDKNFPEFYENSFSETKVEYKNLNNDDSKYISNDII